MHRGEETSDGHPCLTPACFGCAGLPWTQLMDAALLAAGRELGSSKEDVLAACQTTPLAACMQQVCA